MAEYEVKWRTDATEGWQGWESDTHYFPTHVTLEAIGQRGAADAFVRFEMRDGVPEVVEFSMRAKDDGRAVRTADLDSFTPLEGLALNAFRRFARSKEAESTDPRPLFGPADEREAWKLAGDLNSAQASRRGPSTNELEQVARIYREALDGRPTEAVQMQMGYSRRTAARRIQQARAAGQLPPTTPGKKNA